MGKRGTECLRLQHDASTRLSKRGAPLSKLTKMSRPSGEFPCEALRLQERRSSDISARADAAGVPGPASPAGSPRTETRTTAESRLPWFLR